MRTVRGVPNIVRALLNMVFLGVTLGAMIGVYMMAEADHDFSVGLAKVIVRVAVPCVFVSFVLLMFREGQGRRADERDGFFSAVPFPPAQPETYTITYRTPCTFCGREPETAGVDTTVRRFSTRGVEPKRREEPKP